MRAPVFISYSRRDYTAIKPCLDALGAGGVAYWLDQSDIPVSVPWLDEIEHAIKGAVLIVIFESSHSAASQSCAAELNIATGLSKRVVRFHVDHLLPEEATQAVRTLLRETTRDEGVRAVLLSQSHRWDTSGRRAGYLASGRLLRDFRKISWPDTRRDDTALAYMKRSLRRQRRRRAAAIALVTVTVGGFGLVSFTSALSEATQRKVAEQANHHETIARVSSTISADGYAGVRAALDAATNDEAFFNREILASAMEANLPASITPSSGQGWQVAAALPNGYTIQAGDLRATLSQSPSRVDVERNGALYRTLPVGGAILAMAWSPDHGVIALADRGGIRVFDLTRSEQITVLRGLDGKTSAIEWSDWNTVIGHSPDGGAATWHITNADRLARSGKWFMAMAAAPDGKSGAAISRDGYAVAITDTTVGNAFSLAGSGIPAAITWTPVGWAVARNELVLLRPDGTQDVRGLPPCRMIGLAWNAKTERLVGACSGSDFYEVDLPTGQAHKGDSMVYLSSVTAASDGVQYFGSQDGEISVGSAEGSVNLFREYFIGCVLSNQVIAVSPDNRFLANGGAGMNGDCLRVSSRTPDGWSQVPVPPPLPSMRSSRALAFSHDSSLVAVGFSDGHVWLFDPNTFNTRLLHSVTGSEIRGLQFSQDDRKLTVLTRDGDALAVNTDVARQSIGDWKAELQRRLSMGQQAKLTS